jgi:hypothetical protein
MAERQIGQKMTESKLYRAFIIRLEISFFIKLYILKSLRWPSLI